MRLLFATLLLTPCLFAEGPEFEAASIKLFVQPTNGSTGARRGGGPGTTDPTHIMLPGGSLKTLLTMAFGFKNYQVIGPDSLDSDRFDFAVALPEGATRDDVKIMWRNLLVSRFGLKYHIEQREFQVDELVVAPKGQKLTKNTDPPPQPNPDGTFPPPERPKIENGRPILTSAMTVTMTKAGPTGVTATMFARGETIAGLTSMLASELAHPVIDKTGLTGKYDFTLEYLPNARTIGEMSARVRGNGDSKGAASPAVNTDLPLDLPNALQQQLGLRLVRGKDKLNVVIVEKIERMPTEN
jgi:uncharacterized protein (TIGR03435 family)